MSKYYLFFILTAVMLGGTPVQAYSPSGGSHTLTHNKLLELKPASLQGAYKTAAICFLGVGDCDPIEKFEIDSAEQCKNEGYSLQNCAAGQVIDGVCPYDSSYGRGCKCPSNLMSCPAGQIGVGTPCNGRYASCQCNPNLVSCPSDKRGTGASCGGKFEGCTCKSEYLYTSSNCTYPKSLRGASCDGKYTECVCPAGVSTGSFGCAEYYPSPCSGVCKRAKSDNCDNRTAVSTPYGCYEFWADCSEKCKTAYNDNCRNRTAVTCPYDCASYFGDCQSKCSGCDGDNCKNRTAVIADCPSNAVCSYFTDCTSKISSWKCKDGYKQSGNSCVEDKPTTCEDFGYYTEEPAGLGEKCMRKYVTEAGLFCYTNDCKRCQLELYCKNGCAEYNHSETAMDLYGCPRVCISCKTSELPKPSCGSDTLITCNGVNYCCPPRAASCYYTTPHNNPDGTTTVMCSLLSKTEEFTDSGKIDGNLTPIAPPRGCLGTWTTCNGMKCCCRSGESCNGPKVCLCQNTGGISLPVQ